MKFVELKSSLKTEVLPCYLVQGEDDFLCNSCLNLMEKQLFGSVMRNNLNKQVVSTENLDANKFIDILNTVPFFAKQKLVVLKQYDDKVSNDIISQLKSYLANPCASTVLVIYALNSSDVFKMLKSNLCVVDCSRLDKRNIAIWVHAKLKNTKKIIDNAEVNVTINDDALNLLIDYTNSYLSKISMELDKLIAYAGSTITIHDVEDLVSKDLEYSIFELTDAIGQSNKTKAVMIKNDLMSDRKTFNTTLSVCSNFFRRLFLSITSPLPNSEIASMLGVKEYAITKSKEIAPKFGAKTLKQIVELCADLDYKTKTSEMSLENATDYLLAFILNARSR